MLAEHLFEDIKSYNISTRWGHASGSFWFQDIARIKFFTWWRKSITIVSIRQEIEKKNEDGVRETWLRQAPEFGALRKKLSITVMGVDYEAEDETTESKE